MVFARREQKLIQDVEALPVPFYVDDATPAFEPQAEMSGPPKMPGGTDSAP